MDDFFKQIDQELNAQEIERKRQNAEQAFYTQQANIFAKRLSRIVQEYVEPLKKRGFRISEECNFPYWSLVITSPKAHEALLSIQSSNTLACGYALNYYKNGEARYHKYEALVQQNSGDADIKKMIEETVQSIL